MFPDLTDANAINQIKYDKNNVIKITRQVFKLCLTLPFVCSTTVKVSKLSNNYSYKKQKKISALIDRHTSVKRSLCLCLFIIFLCKL